LTQFKKLESLAYRLNDLNSLRKLFAELNYDFADEPANKKDWSESDKDIVIESKIIAKKDDYLIYYIQTKTDSLKQWKSVAIKIIKERHGLCLICSHNPSGFKWVFSTISKEFSKSFSETRHIPVEIRPNTGAPRNFIDFLSKISADNDTAISIATKVSDAFDTFAIQIHDELTINVFEALKILSEGVITEKSNELKLTTENLEMIREPLFIILYRIMFILYAEDRGIFPVDEKLYYQNFSLRWIKYEWLLKQERKNELNEYEVQKRLWLLFKLVELGSEGLNYDHNVFFMRPYYGRLFDRKIYHQIEKWKLKNDFLLKIIALLTRTTDQKRNYFFLDYAALETKHLGSIYEHLLEYHLFIKDGKIAELPDPNERKLSGSYYTPDDVVEYIIKNTIQPKIDKIISETIDKGEQIEKILSLNILDPSMGSGHFLIAAVNYIAKRLCEIEDGEVSEQRFVDRKREVARRCIYGIDLNPLAVDLAMVALWLETLSSEKPLSFLTAHLKHGNTLLGEKIKTLFNKQMTLVESEKGREHFRKSVKDFLIFENLEDDSANAVKTKMEKYEKMQSRGTIYYDLKFLLNCKTAELFGIKIPALGDYKAKIGENSLDFYINDSLKNIKELSDKHKFFHWEIEYPDIFFDEKGNKKTDGGFDVVIGNPPYIERSKLEYPVNHFVTNSCGNSYAYFFEKGIELLKKDGIIGFIVPISSVCTARMHPLQKIILTNSQSVYISNFDDRPGKLFPTLEHCRSSIIIATKNDLDDRKMVYTTKYNRWYTEERKNLFNNLKYVHCTNLIVPGIIPKISTELEKDLLTKIRSCPNLGIHLTDKSENIIWYHNAPQYWIRAMDFVPVFSNKMNSASSHVKPLCIINKKYSRIIISVLNSSLFYWYFVSSSNCRDLTLREIENFGMDLDKLSKENFLMLQLLCDNLMRDYKKRSKTKVIESAKTGKVTYQEFFPSYSKPIIDEIDEILTDHYDLSKEEIDFIKHFDEKFRMGEV